MDLRAGGVRLGGYAVERELGRGGMGTVYLARDERLDRMVALKVVAPALADDERFRERFLRESRLAARLEHPSIVPVYQAGDDAGQLFLAMRYIAGGTLAARLASGPLEPSVALGYLGDVAAALDAAHGAGLVHRDVKPGNILLDGDRALLADFGLAQAAMSPESLSREGFTGTVGYVAPEQIEGDAVTGAADQYALACVAFECLTGSTPFVRDTDLAAIYAHLSEPPPKASGVLPTVPLAADAVLARALAKRPADRFPSCAAFTTALAETLTTAGAVARRRTRRLVAAGAAALAVVGAGGGVVATRGGGASAPLPRADALVTLDPRSGRVEDVIPLGQRPTAVTVAPDGIWVALAGAYQVVRVDPATRQITQRVPAGGLVNGLVAAGGSIWATVDAGRDLLRIDAASGQVGQRIDVANAPGAVAVARGSLWVASRLDGDVTQVDIATGKPVRKIPIGAGVTDVIEAFGSVWAASEDQASVTRIDPATGAVTDTVPVGHAPTALAATRDALWVANRGDGTVSRLDPARNAVIAVVPVGQAPGTVVATAEDVLVGDDLTGAVYRLSASTPTATRVAALRATAADLAATAGGGVLATTTGLPSSHRGGVLRIADLNAFWATDPAMDWSNPTTWVWDTLIRYRRTGGAAGLDLVPDLASAIPRPSDGGRTYLFHVRPAVRYSTGVVVRPSDFTRAFQRLAVGKFEFWGDPEPHPTFWSDTYSGIVGYQACLDRPAACDLSKGVVADDAAGTLTFHLTQSDDDFIRKLTLTLSAPVPPGTPVNGSWRRPPVPGTGPYLIASEVAHHEMIERRNPYFHVWSPDARPDGNPDEIDWLLDISRQRQIDLILAGKVDGGFTIPYGSQVAPVLAQHPSQVYVTPAGPIANEGWFFNVKRFPLSSRDVRRAINYAIDRPAYLRAANGTAAATCQSVRLGAAGYVPFCPYGSGGVATGQPNLAKARALVRRAGADGAKVTIAVFQGITDPNDWRAHMGPAQRELLGTLRAIGLVPVPHALGDNWDDFYNDTSQISYSLSDNDGSRSPAAGDLGNVVADCDPEAIAFGVFCDAETRRLLAAANTASDPVTQARAWARLDRYLTDQAAWLPIGSGLNPVILSKRTGNYAQQNALLGSLWELLTVR